MRAYVGIVLATLLLTACSDSSTETTATNDAGSESNQNQNTDSEQSSDNGDSSDANPGDSDSSDGDSSGSTDGDSNSGGSGGDSGSGDVDSGDGSSGEGDSGDGDSGQTGGGTVNPPPTLVQFSGEDFGYPRINANYYTLPELEHLTIDPREEYTVWAANYVSAQALLEAMHAINFYRADHQQIKTLNAGTQALETLIRDYCPTSGANFAADRCQFYAQLAYRKTTAQDGWQIEHRQTNAVPLVCGSVALKFLDCSYSLLGNTGLSTATPNMDLVSTLVSPIEGWQYEYNSTKIIAINTAVVDYLNCALSDDAFSNNYFAYRPALSPWAINEQVALQPVTQYGTLPVWIVSKDTVEDVYTDVTAQHNGLASCKASFAADLKTIEPGAAL